MPKHEIEHIDHQIPPQIHSKNEEPMYHIHKYWARKPFNVVSEYIKHYSKNDEIVLDPFAGSGVTALEAVKLGRKGIAIDRNPIASFITYCTAVDVNIRNLNDKFKLIEDSVKHKIYDFYSTRCKKCGKPAVASHVVWKQNKKTKEEKPIAIYYFCNSCSKGIIRKEPDEEDLRNIKRINRLDINYWYPKIKFKYENGKNFAQLRHDMIQHPTIEMLFTRRNLHLSAMIFDAIEKLPVQTKDDKIVKDLLKLNFTAFIAKATKMNIINVGGYTSKGRGWTLHFFWNPEEYIEQNVWNDFASQFETTLAAKEQTNSIGYRIAKDFEELLDSDKNILILTASAADLINDITPRRSILKEDSVDYIFTDPPYGNSIQYYELSILWNSWLGFNGWYEDEIIINKNQGKGFQQYEGLLVKSFKQMFRIVKRQKYLTVTFHNEKIKIRNALIRSVVFSGFTLQKILYQSPSKIPAKASLHPYGTPVGDYYIRFYKSEKEAGLTPQQIDRKVQERVVIDAVTKILAQRGEPTSYVWIINTIDTELIERGYNLISEPIEIKSILENHKGKEFIIVDVKEGQNVFKKWWFKDPSCIASLGRIPLSERVEKGVIDILRREIIVRFDEVLRHIFLNFPNSLTPETHSVKSILAEYAKKLPDGRWKIKDSLRNEIREHQLKINQLVLLGKQFGFATYTPDVVDEIREYVTYPLNLPIDEQKMSKIREIDVVWIDNNQIKYSFEVENSTQISEGIIRGSNIPYQNNRIIVIPDERERLLERKFKNVLLESEVQRSNWTVLLYSFLDGFLEKRKKTLQDFDKLLSKPRSTRVKQKSLSDW